MVDIQLRIGCSEKSTGSSPVLGTIMISRGVGWHTLVKRQVNLPTGLIVCKVALLNKAR